MYLKKEFESQGSWLFRHRGWLPIIILISGLLVFLQKQSTLPASSPIWSNTMLYEFFCMTVGLSGLFIRAYTVGYSHANTSGRNTKGQVADMLNMTGIYSVVRNPLYLGNFLTWLSVGLLTANVWFIIVFCLLFCLFYERIIFTEEQFLERKFGETFTRWAELTPAFFPRLRLFTKPDTPFSWKKVIRAEKNGLFGLFFVFAVFDIAGMLVRGDHQYNIVLIAGCAVTFIIYLVAKYLKYHTSILDS